MIQLSKNTKLICGGVVLCLLTIVPAVLHGSLLNRWGTGKQLDEAGQSINGLPTQLGKWIQVGEDDVLSKDVLKELAINEYASRVYSDPQSGEQVRLLLMSGQPGPLVLHPPDICYAMTGRQLIQKTPKCSITVGGQQHHFKVLRYRDGGAVAGEFYVVYGFFDGSEWNKPKYPRLAYGGNRWLWKVQVLSSTMAEEGEDIPAPARDFLEELITSVSEGGAVVATD